MQKCLWGLRRENQGTLSMCYTLKNNIRLLMIHCCLVNKYCFIIRWVFIEPEFCLLLRDKLQFIAFFLFFFSLLFGTKQEQMCRLVLHIAQPPSLSGWGWWQGRMSGQHLAGTCCAFAQSRHSEHMGGDAGTSPASYHLCPQTERKQTRWCLIGATYWYMVLYWLFSFIGDFC